jgi:hypothetical protein
VVAGDILLNGTPGLGFVLLFKAEPRPKALPESGDSFPIFDLQFLKRFSEGDWLGKVLPGVLVHDRQSALSS